MYKKIFIQILLVLIVLIIIGSIFYFYLFDQRKIIENLKKRETTQISTDKDKDDESVSSSIINNIKYVSKDNEGNEYEIVAKKGEMNISNPEVIYMTDVYAIISMKNLTSIYINSDYAIYNSQNYDTTFTENVIINYITHKITGEKLDLSFQTNMAIMSKNVIYKNINTVLNADRLEIDLITKNSRIFMEDKYEKIKILVKK